MPAEVLTQSVGTGTALAVGAAAVQLPARTGVKNGIALRAAPGNTAPIVLGGPGVTTGGADSFCALAPADPTLKLPVYPTALWAISAAGQTLYVGGY